MYIFFQYMLYTYIVIDLLLLFSIFCFQFPICNLNEVDSSDFTANFIFSHIHKHVSILQATNHLNSYCWPMNKSLPCRGVGGGGAIHIHSSIQVTEARISKPPNHPSFESGMAPVSLRPTSGLEQLLDQMCSANQSQSSTLCLPCLRLNPTAP